MVSAVDKKTNLKPNSICSFYGYLNSTRYVALFFLLNNERE